MATYAQLSAESWWNREIVTPELRWLGDELCRRTGQPRTAAGTKGNDRHLRGSHRSQEWILNSRYCTDERYTVQSGLTAEQRRHIAGFDFTPGAWGTAENRRRMVEQSKRIIAAMKAGRLDEVREFYGTTDGRTVTGWNNVENRAASSDSSHLDHWHAGVDRRHCDNKELVERIVRIALGEEEDDVALTDQQDKMLRAIDARVRALAGLTPTLTTTWAADSDEVEQVAASQALTAIRDRPAAVVDYSALAEAIVARLPETTLTRDDVRAAAQSAVEDVLRNGVGAPAGG